MRIISGTVPGALRLGALGAELSKDARRRDGRGGTSWASTKGTSLARFPPMGRLSPVLLYARPAGRWYRAAFLLLRELAIVLAGHGPEELLHEMRYVCSLSRGEVRVVAGAEAHTASVGLIRVSKGYVTQAEEATEQADRHRYRE